MKFSIFQKRAICVVLFICFSIGIYGIINLLEGLKSNNTVQTNALPITNKIIVLDAGHGLPDAGAEGFNGTTEQAINLSIALKLQKVLEQSGAKVILTRSDENGIYELDSKSIKEKKVSDAKNRVEIGNNNFADVFISIHLNKFPPSQIYRGWQTFYKKDNEDSKILAEFIQENLNKNIEFKNDRLAASINNIYVIDNLKVPAVIVECGFLSNPDETELLKTDNYQNKLVWGIYTGLQNYFLSNNE